MLEASDRHHLTTISPPSHHHLTAPPPSYSPSSPSPSSRHRYGLHVQNLDGDNVRTGLNRDLGFSPGDRAESVRRVGEMACLFTGGGVITLVTLVSPYQADRDAARERHEEQGLKVSGGHTRHHPAPHVTTYHHMDHGTARRHDPFTIVARRCFGQPV